VNYRLAPEHPFPAAVEDAYHALCWVHQNIKDYGGDPEKIAVVGESSGGNLAAAMTIMSHCRQGPPLCFQVLIYPQLDYTNSFPSHKLFADGYFLTEQALNFYAQKYLPEQVDRKDPYVSPYFTHHFQYLPPAYIITAEYDPLRDEAESYAHQLKKAGVSVIHHRFPGMIHGFVSMVTFIEEAREALQMICDTLQAIFRKGDYKKSA
jgi:acetyl esterase